MLITGLRLCSYLPRPGVIKANRSGGDPRNESVAERGEIVKREFLENLKIGAYLRHDDLEDDIRWVYDLFPRPTMMPSRSS